MSGAKIIMMRLFSIMLVAVIVVNQVSADDDFEICVEEVQRKLDGQLVVTDLMKKLSTTIEEKLHVISDMPNSSEHLLEILEMSSDEASQLYSECKTYGTAFKNAVESTPECPRDIEAATVVAGAIDALRENLPEVFEVLEDCSILTM